MLSVSLTLRSTNQKTGPIPVTTTSSETCPPTCSWYNSGCYANYGPLGLHWRKVSSGERGVSWETFIEWVKDLPSGTLWRHNQAGDLPGEGVSLDIPKCVELAEASKHTRGFTYTHKDFHKHAATLHEMNSHGFTVNTSCDSLDEAWDSYRNYQLPTTVMIPPEHEDVNKFHYKNVEIARCPAEYLDKTCVECQLCARPNRQVIVGFTPHGAGKNRIKDKLK